MNIETFLSINASTGRIDEIIDNACIYYRKAKPSLLTTDEMLEFLCKTMQIDSATLDDIIANSSEVMRTVKGHTFEVVFEHMMDLNSISCDDIGGDSDIDLVVNGRNTQLKTPYMNGCSEEIVAFKTHKTHGAKSERESMDYYHKVSDFADYMIGLVSYEPFKVVIIPKEELPRVSSDSDYIQSPMFISIEKGNYINQFRRLNIYKKLMFPPKEIALSDDEALPLSSKAISVKSEYILSAIYRKENFRIWDMNIRGFIRERSIKKLFLSNGINEYPASVTGLPRPEKSDFVLKNRNGQYIRFQVKGLTLRGCIFNGSQSQIDCETQLSRGRVNDHPTRSRLYMTSDFDFLIIAMDPPYTNHFHKEVFNSSKYEWSFYCVPASALKRHSKYTNRVASHQKILFTDLQQYLIDSKWLNQWS